MKNKTWRTWTRKEIELLKQLLHDGKSMAEAARVMGRTYPSVKCRVDQEGIQMSEIKKGRRRMKWLDAFAKPHTLREIAERMGLTLWAVKQAKRRLRRAAKPKVKPVPVVAAGRWENLGLSRE